MKIGITLYPYNEKEPAGLGRSLIELVRSLISYDRENQYILYSRGAGSAVVAKFPPGQWVSADLGRGSFIVGLGFWLAPKANLYVFNTPVVPLLFWPRRSLVIVHDLAYWHLPPVRWSDWLRRWLLHWYHGFSLRRVGQIVAVSETTKKDLMKTYGLAGDKIRVIYWGFKSICSLPPKPAPVHQPFFLSVGVIKERKNTRRTVNAFIRIHYLIPKYTLILAGKGGGEYEEKIKEDVARAGVADKVRFLGFVDDNELSYLYAHAQALVFPSLIEGFGFPILEAMDCGLPVITSNTSSLKELAAGAALLVDPRDEEAIGRAMVRVVKDAALRARLREEGKRRARQFTWQKTVEQYREMFKDQYAK